MSTGEVSIPALELEDELGHGAFSVVYRARRGDRRCAVKIGRTGGAMARWFRREAAALARVRDPGVPEVLDVGIVDGRPYLVMDLVSGPTLEEQLAKGPMSLAETIALGRELCRILGEVHRRGLVHRDIKPRNIIIGARGRPTLVDFGLVTHLDPVFDVDAAAGTRSYAAPEQIRAPLLVDRRADLYALGRVLTECLGGRSEPLLAPVLDRLLEEDPALRYADANELDRDLARIERGDAALGADAPDASTRADERAPLVGRSAELDQVRGEWGRAMLGRGTVVFYEGAPGSGKTRLLDAIVRNLDPGLLLRCEGRGPLPMAALRDMLEAYLHDGGPDADARAAALREAAAGPHAPLVASISTAVGRALGSTEELRERDHETFVEAVAEVILRLARAHGSMLVLVDDLQWLDPVSREVLVRVALGARGAPLLFVAAARTDSQDLAPLARFVAALGDTRFQPRRLAPFGLREVREIVSVYLGAASPDPLLVEHVATLADETPLGALECLGALLDGGALRPSWGTWIFDRDAADRIWLPGEITNLLERRLGQIPQATLRVLETAAVVGSRFAIERVARIVGIEPGDVLVAVSECVRAGLVELGPGGEPRFVHETVRETVLRAVDANRKRALHQRAADVLSKDGATDAKTLFALAEHTRDGEPERDPRRVFDIATRAAKQAIASLDYETALPFFGLAAVAAGRAKIPLDAVHHLAVADAELRIGALRECIEALGRALAVASPAERAPILAKIAWVHSADGQPERAWAALDSAFAELGVRMPKEAPLALGESLATTVKARVLGLAHRRVADSERRRMETLCELHYQNARLGFESGKPARTLVSALAILAQGERLGASSTLARAYAMYGMFMTVLGRGGGEYLDRARRMAESLGDTAAVANIVQHGFVCACFAGELDRALTLVRECVDGYGPWLEVSELALNVDSARFIESLRGRPREAWAWSERALLRVRRHGKVPAIFPALVAPGVRAELDALGRADELEELLGEYARNDGLAEARGVHRLLSWGSRSLRFAEGTGGDEELASLERAFEAEGINPRTAHPVVCEYYISIAHVRARRALAAPPGERAAAIASLDRALADLKKAARLALFKAHLVVLEGYRALAAGDAALAEAKFRAADVMGRDETAPWVRACAAHGQALLLLRAGKVEAARDEGRLAVALSLDHGAVHRAERMARDLGLEFRAASEARRLRHGSRSSSSRGRQLGALLRVVQTKADLADARTQAEGVVDELIRALGAERGMLLFERPHGAGLVVARRIHGPDEADEALRAALRAVRDGEGGGESPRALSERLALSDRPVGAIRLERAASARPFNPAERELFATLADQVAVTLELGGALEERGRLEESLRQAQKMEAVGQLASGIAHDFNNMLMAILSSVDGIGDRPNDKEELEADVATIREASRRAAELTHQLLAFSRRQVLTLGVVDLGDLIAHLVPMLKRLLGPHVEVRLSREPVPARVKTDKASFEQALINLAVNARDAMPKGGVLTIEVGEVTLDESWLARGAARAGRHVCVRVSDTGVGIPPEVRGRIFEPFFTTKEIGAGAGLGLASVYGFVKQTDGHIEVQSEPDQGTTFLLYIPTSTEPFADDAAAAPPTSRERSGRATILVAEDEHLVRRSMIRTLERAGFHVLAAGDGREALDLARRAERVDLVITDVLMPVVNGPELARRLTETGIDAPVLFVSGYAEGELSERGVLAAGVAFLEKPTSAEKLIERVHVLLGTDRPSSR